MGGKCPKNWTQIVKHLLKPFQVQGAKMTGMDNYVKRSIWSSRGHFILHVGTNDLSFDKSPEEMARSITDLATSIKNEKRDTSTSNIIIRADDKKN